MSKHHIPTANNHQDHASDDILADYILDLLEADAHQQVKSHLETCMRCQSAYARLYNAFYALPDALEPLPIVKNNQPQQMRFSRTSVPVKMWAGYALSVITLVVAIVWGTLFSLRYQHLDNEHEQLARWMADPNMHIVALDTHSADRDALPAGIVPGILCNRPIGRSLLVQETPPPSGMVYKAWGIRSGQYIPLGTSHTRLLRFDYLGYEAIQVSLERNLDGSAPTLLLGSMSVPDATTSISASPYTYQ